MKPWNNIVCCASLHKHVQIIQKYFCHEPRSFLLRFRWTISTKIKFLNRDRQYSSNIPLGSLVNTLKWYCGKEVSWLVRLFKREVVIRSFRPPYCEWRKSADKMFSRTAAIIPQWLVKTNLKFAEMYVFENYCASI